MADFTADLGNAIKASIAANGAAFGQALAASGASYHVEYGDQPVTYLHGAGSRCYIRFERDATLASYDTSAESEFHYIAAFKCVDVKGKQGALTLIKNGISAVVANSGRTLLTTYLTDNGSNWLAKSGEVTAELEAQPLDSLDAVDYPLMFVRFKIVCGHVVPLV